ncbi:T9SS type A sorting domain-containing protein [Aureispira anguillae]|nr:T9SS type A sorting domain-containing protein [Aureispira anguillae]
MKYLILTISLFYFSNTRGQQHDNTWMLSQEYGNLSTQVEFLPTVTTDTAIRNLKISKTNLTVSDSLGNLLFYTNGIKIYNTQYQLMQNGNGLNPGQLATNSTNGYPYVEAITSIPHPVQANKYYVFHQGVSYSSALDGFAEKLYYTLVDMNANGGLGRVDKKNQVLLENDSMCVGQLEVVKHGNGRDWWLIQPMAYSNGYYIFLIADSTITYHHKQYIGNVSLHDSEFIGQATFTHQGDKYFRYDQENDLDMFDFDRCTGYLANYEHIPVQDSADNVAGGFFMGVAVSPNDRYLYVSSYIYMYQFDLWASNIASTRDTVGVYDNHLHIGIFQTFFGSIQTAPDGKIYSVSFGSPYLHVINNPNVGGVGCDVVQRGQNLLFINSHIPNFPHYRTPALSGSACDTITSIETVETPEKEIQIYPNPTSGLVYIEAVQEIEQLSIHDALGRKVYWYHQPRQQGITLDTQQWDNGIYYISIWLDGKIVQEKIHVLR